MPNDEQRHHILAINDSADVLRLFDDLLTDAGYRVSTMSYATHDLAEIEAIGPDLIILDYMWSGDDSGWSLLQMIKMSPKARNIPVILCTGAVRHVTELSARLDEMGVRVVFKPFDIDELLRTVKDVLQPTTAQTSDTDTSTR